MKFVFRRDEEGRETIYVNMVPVAAVHRLEAESASVHCHRLLFMAEVDIELVVKAISAAEKSGFWAPPNGNDPRFDRMIVGLMGGDETVPIRVAEVVVDVERVE